MTRVPCATVLSLVLGVATARAQEPPASPTAQPTTSPASDAALSANDEEARRQFEVGRERFAARDFVSAAASFQRAYDLSRRKELLYNIGVCRRELGQVEPALDAFRQYLAFSGPNGSNAEQIRQQIADLERLRPAHLEVQSRNKAGEIAIDGHAAGRTPLDLTLAPGSHTLVAEGPWPTERRELSLLSGERKIIEVGRKSRTGMWIGIGVGAAVVVGAVVTVAAVLATRPANVHTGTLDPGEVYVK